MKKISILLSLIALCAVSCDSYFDVNLQDQEDLETTFSRKQTTKQFLAHLYNYIPREEIINGKHEGGVTTRGDEVLFGSSTYASIWYNYRTGDYSSATPAYKNVADATALGRGNIWPRYYEAIDQCSIFLENVDKDIEDTEEVREYMKAEVRFLRAYYYFILFRQYGPVIIWGDQRAGFDVVGKELDRNTVNENIDFIVSELDHCISVLPNNVGEVGTLTAESETGRITKGAAMALKARVLLYAASPLYNGQNGRGIYNGMVNKDGKRIFSALNTDDNGAPVDKWKRAAEAAEAVIGMSQYKLIQAKGDTFQDYADAYQNVFFDRWNTETIWGWWFHSWEDYLGTTGGFIAYAAPRDIVLYGFQLLTPSLKLVDAYPMWETGRYPVTGYKKDADGLDYSQPEVDPKSGYQADGWTENYQQVVDVEPLWATPFKAHNSTVGRDPRYYSCLVPNGFWWPSRTTAAKGHNITIEEADETTGKMVKKTINPVRFTCYDSQEATSRWKQDGEVNRVGYSWRRWYKAGNPLSKQTDYTSLRYIYPAFRLAEMYLAAAEAYNEMGSRDEAKALRYLNAVRNRVGLNNIEEAYPEVVGNKELLRWCIRQEKFVEFGLEGAQRWFDNNRWMVSEDENTCGNWTLHVKANTYEDSYTRVKTDYMGNPAVFGVRDYFFPMSSDEMAEIPNYTQNYNF